MTQCTITINAMPGGTTGPPPGPHIYVRGGLVVGITAFPDVGYEFDHWTGDLYWFDPYDNPISLYADDGYLTANFRAVGPPPPSESTITITVTGQGDTDPAVGVHTRALHDNLYVTAIEHSGSGWKYSHMNRNGNLWTRANPGEFLDLQETEAIEVAFTEDVIPIPIYPEPWTFMITQEILDDVSSRFGAIKGSVSYMPYYDVNNDEKIDVKDIAWFSGNLGKIVTLPLPGGGDLTGVYIAGGILALMALAGAGYWLYTHPIMLP